MELEQLEDSSEQNNTVPDARPTKRAVAFFVIYGYIMN